MHFLFHWIDAHILDGLGEDEFIGDEDNDSCFVYETSGREGNLFHHAFISFDPDPISDFEIVTENEWEAPGEVRDGFFAGESEEYSPDSGSCHESSNADAEYSEYEDECNNPNEDGNHSFDEGKYFLGESVVLEESSKHSGEDEIGDERWNICPAENHDDRESFTDEWKIGNYITVKIHRCNEGERECQISAGKSDKENGHEKNFDTHKKGIMKLKISFIFAKNDFFATRIWFF